MSQAANLATQERFGKAVNTNNLDDINDLVDPDCIDHDPEPGQARGPQGFIGFFRHMITAFPDFAVAVDQMVADEQSISIAYTMTGTHRGEFLGIAPTGRKIRARGVQIAKFNDHAKVIERWGSSDQLGILQQLGGA